MLPGSTEADVLWSSHLAVKAGRLCSSRYSAVLYAVQKSVVSPVGSLLICVER